MCAIATVHKEHHLHLSPVVLKWTYWSLKALPLFPLITVASLHSITILYPKIIRVPQKYEWMKCETHQKKAFLQLFSLFSGKNTWTNPHISDRHTFCFSFKLHHWPPAGTSQPLMPCRQQRTEKRHFAQHWPPHLPAWRNVVPYLKRQRKKEKHSEIKRLYYLSAIHIVSQGVSSSGLFYFSVVFASVFVDNGSNVEGSFYLYAFYSYFLCLHVENMLMMRCKFE